jgi:hypothetical protein
LSSGSAFISVRCAITPERERGGHPGRKNRALHPRLQSLNVSTR